MSDENQDGTPDEVVDEVDDIVSGYVSPNARNTNVPLLGHMVTYRFAERESDTTGVSFEDMVEQAKELGLGADNVPNPRYGKSAFKYALKTFKTSWLWITADMGATNWDNMRCKVKYDIERMDKEYAIIRTSTGLKDGIEDVEIEPLYRVKYTGGRGDVVARAHNSAYVKRTWLGEDELEEAELERLNNNEDGTDLIEFEPFDGSNIHNMTYFSNAVQLVRERYRQVCTTVDTRLYRNLVKNKLLNNFNAIPFTALRGAYIVPDLRSEEQSKDEDGNRTAPPYLNELDAVNSLMKWYGGNAEETTSVVNLPNENIPGVTPEEDEVPSAESLVDHLQAMFESKCQMTIMAYIDDAAQQAELQRELTLEVNKRLNEYYKELGKTTDTLGYLEANDGLTKEAIDRLAARMLVKKAELNQALETFCGDTYIDGVKIEIDAHLPRARGAMTRLRAIAPPGSDASRLVELFDLSDTAGIGIDDLVEDDEDSDEGAAAPDIAE